MSNRVRLSLLVTLLVIIVFYLWAVSNKAAVDKALLLSFTAGILAGGWVYLFYYTGRRNKNEIKSEGVAPGVLMQGSASHFHDGEEVGGTLFMLDEELVFQSHSFSLRKHEMRVPIVDISDAELFEKYGHRNGGLKITLHSGQVIRFGTHHAERWMKRINDLSDRNTIQE